MENDILKHRMAVMNNIAKSFGYEKSEDLLEKAEDNDIEKAKHQDGDMHPNGKWVWCASANGGKGDWRVAKKGSSSTSGGSGSAGNSTSDFDSLSSAKTQLEVNKFWENLLTSNSGKGKNLAGKLLDSMKEYGYNNVSGAMTTRGINTFKFANKDADENITMVPYQDGLVIKTNDKKEILKVSDFKTISDFKKKFDETVLKLSGKKDDKKKPEKSSYDSKKATTSSEAAKKKVKLTPDNAATFEKKLNDALDAKGYYAHATSNGSIEIYEKGKRRALKNLLVSVQSSDYMDWGGNAHLKSELEPIIKQAFIK